MRKKKLAFCIRREIEKTARHVTTASKYLGIGVTLLNLSFMPQSALAATETSQIVNLPEAPLTTSLTTLGRQYGVNLVFTASELDGLTNSPVRGQLTLPEALDSLLQNIGFVAEKSGDSYLILRQQPLMFDSHVTVLDQLLVKGRAGLDQVNKTATKMDLSIRDTGRSIVVLDERALREMNATAVDQVLDYVPGFSNNDTAAGSLMVRGLVTDYNNVLIDGLRTLQGVNDGDGGRTGSILPSTYNLESVAFLRGQDGLLYGSGIGGGMINLTTKKPEAEASTSLGVHGTSYISSDVGYFDRNHLAFNLDSTGPLSDNVLYRVMAQRTPSGDFFQKGLEVDEKLLDTSMTFLIGDNTRITPRIEYAERNFSGTGSVGKVFEKGYFSSNEDYGTPTQREYQYGSPEDFNNNTTINADLTLQHDFNEDWSLSSRLRYSETEAEQRSLELSIPRNPLAGAPTQDRRWRGYKNDDSYELLDIGVQGQFTTGPLSHHLLFGGSYRDFSTDYGGNYQSSSSSEHNEVDVNNPNDQITGPVPDNVLNYEITPKSVKDINIYLKDRITFGDLVITPGVSYVQQDQVRSRSSRLSFVKVYEDSYSKFIWDLGLLYKLSDDFNVFATYSYAYDPLNVRYIGQYGYEYHGLGTDDYVPVEGNNYEVGFKADFFDNNLTTSVTAFQLDRENKTSFDCNLDGIEGCLLTQAKGPNFRSKGVEVDLTFTPNSQWSGSLNYAFTRSAFTKGADKGIQSDNSPKHSVALWNRYRLTGDLNNFKLGLGLRYESERRFSSNVVPAYIEADAGVYYDNEDWEVALLLKNAFDENRAETGSRNFLVVPNEPRALTFSVKHHF
ncbi:TonB-dependent receptor [Oceanimonas baumannii]|uniref:TonB-dependent siderophore receptor n=1 Tax=Oceanimonas baumannii TaxID=129578 RepID=UPI001D19193C|nr:TonB-dependent receptor [Oceanimonas baumannii]MCC4263624.1 TonB-dependent receptor [Oceanimonas baumannii]